MKLKTGRDDLAEKILLKNKANAIGKLKSGKVLSRREVELFQESEASDFPKFQNLRIFAGVTGWPRRQFAISQGCNCLYAGNRINFEILVKWLGPNILFPLMANPKVMEQLTGVATPIDVKQVDAEIKVEELRALRQENDEFAEGVRQQMESEIQEHLLTPIRHELISLPKKIARLKGDLDFDAKVASDINELMAKIQTGLPKKKKETK
jgi:hypothetical protein